jgi:prepilin-type N-terminal cleavage/methylation domain-containing protein
MTAPRRQSRAGFTLVELLVGMSLALIVMTGVLSTFSFLGRNLNRLANQQQLESESRRALAYFAQDVRMANALQAPTAWSSSTAYAVGDVTVSSSTYYRCTEAHTNQAPPNATYWIAHDYANCLVLDISTSNGNRRVIYNSYAANANVKVTTPSATTVTIPAGSFTRTIPAGAAPLTLLRNILIVTPATNPPSSRFSFKYFDTSDNMVSPTGANNKVSSIKKVAMRFNTRTGSSANGTETPVFPMASPRLALRNKAPLN